jgi:acetyltransferase-like isoleucine patch superfamily enzyme
MFSWIKWRVLYALKGSTYAARFLGVKIGEGCRIYTSSFGMEPWLISIGDRVTVTSGVQFITHDGATWLLRDEKGRRYRYAPIEIGSDVFIGANSIILPGVRIGNRVIVAAGSVINRSIPNNCVVAGVPAGFIKTFDEYERRGLAEFRSDADRRGKSQRQQIDSIVDETVAPEILFPANTGSKNRNEVQPLFRGAPLSELADKHSKL